MDCTKHNKELANKCAQQIAAGDENESLVERFKHCILRDGAAGIKRIGLKFRMMDDNESKTLDLEEFLEGCKWCNVPRLTEDEMKKVFKEFDKDGSGSLCYEEFLAAVRPPMNETRRAIVKQAYDVMDKSGDGVITIDDMKGKYNARNHPKYQNGEMTEQQVFEEYLKNFEADKSIDGRVTLDEWMDYYSGISYSIDDDPYFCLMIRNCWKL